MAYGIKTHLKGYRHYQYLRGRQELADSVDPAKPLIRYIGWLGNANIGDEALYLAFKQTLFAHCLSMPFYDLSVTTLLARFKRDRYVALGGGTLINDDNYLEPLERSQKSGYSTFVFGTGVGDLAYWAKFPDAKRGNSARWLNCLRRAVYVGVRGPRSVKWLHDNGVSQAEIIGDTALSLRSPLRHMPTEQGEIVGLNLGSHDPVSGDAETLYQATLTFSRYLIQRGYKVNYISMHSIDFEIGKRLQSEISHTRFKLEPLSSNVDTVMNQLAQVHFVVGQRLHTTILTCVIGIPNISLSYQPKCLDFLESIDQAALAVPTEGITPAMLIERFEALRANATAIATEIMSACTKLRDRQISTAKNLLAHLRTR